MDDVRENTYSSRDLNPFTAACDTKRGTPVLRQWRGNITAPGKDRARTQTCEWRVEPHAAAQIVLTLRFSLRPHMDRLEIWDAQDSGYGVECYPCSFSMEGSVVTKKFVGKILPTANRYGFVDSYSAVIRTMSRVKGRVSNKPLISQ